MHRFSYGLETCFPVFDSLLASLALEAPNLTCLRIGFADSNDLNEAKLLEYEYLAEFELDLSRFRNLTQLSLTNIYGEVKKRCMDIGKSLASCPDLCELELSG